MVDDLLWRFCGEKWGSRRGRLGMNALIGYNETQLLGPFDTKSSCTNGGMHMRMHMHIWEHLNNTPILEVR